MFVINYNRKNIKLINLILRIHAEFQLNEPPYYPFWFTPAQFNGRLIIAKNLSHVEYFKIYLPNEKLLNIGNLNIKICLI